MYLIKYLIRPHVDEVRARKYERHDRQRSREHPKKSELKRMLYPHSIQFNSKYRSGRKARRRETIAKEFIHAVNVLNKEAKQPVSFKHFAFQLHTHTHTHTHIHTHASATTHLGIVVEGGIVETPQFLHYRF